MSKLTEEIKQALASASPGPWRAFELSVFDGVSIEKVAGGILARTTHHGKMREDAHLMANTPTWLAQLVERVELADKLIGMLNCYSVGISFLMEEDVKPVYAAYLAAKNKVGEKA